jgi:hypothetical protein
MKFCTSRPKMEDDRSKLATSPFVLKAETLFTVNHDIVMYECYFKVGQCGPTG